MKRTFDGENESVQEYTASPVVYELVDEIPDCTVQILRNPATGEESVGWYRGKLE